ncbi:MAG: alpha/beta fold hydrolase [Myxococcota bacterium]
MSLLESAHVEVNGLRLHYLAAGQGAPVLLVHGWPTSSFLWRNVIAPLAERRRVLALDLPGFGRSDKPLSARYDFEFYRDVLDGFLAKLHVERLGLVVHDLGGPAGLYWASQRAARVERLAILNTVVYPELSLAVRGFLAATRVPLLRSLLSSGLGLRRALHLGVVDAKRLRHDALEGFQAPFRDAQAREALLKAGGGLGVDGLRDIARWLPTLESWYPLVKRLVDEAATLAPRPDTGIWEFRSMLRHYTFSRAMCWAALERGARIAERLGHHDDAARWKAKAAEERQVVLQRGYSPAHGCFTQALDGQWADAANLLLPSIGLLDAHDPRFLATLDDYERRLVREGLMLRYVHEDDFGETTSAFTICSFWWAEALALAGRFDRAVQLFERLLRYANPLGLFSEDIEPKSGRLLGNFPQAYTHVGLIHAAVSIGHLLAARDGRVRAWT